ncbi:MAG: SsrA-binding protein SmpB [Christensenellales bacterium]|jgi:SsrA-binding protein
MKVIASNKKASFNYFLLDKFEAGIVLTGSEVKSVRDGEISINESFVQVENDEIFLKNAYIKPYEKASSFVPDEKRNRKLLLHKKQIQRLIKEKQTKNLTIVPTKVYFVDGLVKIEIALAKGKKLYDKRDTMAEKSVKREIDRAVKKLS